MSEHVLVRDQERRLLLCAKCAQRWPCQTKVREVLERINQQAEETRRQPTP